jgi:hypothetical protein
VEAFPIEARHLEPAQAPNDLTIQTMINRTYGAGRASYMEKNIDIHKDGCRLRIMFLTDWTEAFLVRIFVAASRQEPVSGVSVSVSLL